MQLTLPDGHSVHLTPWLLRAVREAFPLPSAPDRLVLFTLDPAHRSQLLQDGLAEPTAEGDLVLTARGTSLHRLLMEPGRLLPESEEGRFTPAPDLSTEQQQEIRTARSRLLTGDRGLRPGDSLEGRANQAFWAAFLPLLAGTYALERFLEDLGLRWFLVLVGLLMLLWALFIRAVSRYRTKEEAKAPERILAGYEGRYILLKELDSPSRELLLRAQRAVDASPNPAVLAAQEWELALMLREHTRAWASATPGDPDHWEQDVIALIQGRQRAEVLLKDLEERAQ